MVLYIEDPNFYSKNVIGLGIEEFAKKINHRVLKLNLYESFTKTDEYTILILEGFLFRDSVAIVNQCECNVEKIKEFFPNSHIIILGSYTHYCENYLEYNHPSKVDLHLDTNYTVSETFKKMGIVSDMFLWSGTQPVYDMAKNYKNQSLINKHRDCICLSNCNINSVSPGQHYYDRATLFRGIINSGFSLAFGFQKFDFNEVFLEYLISDINIGTTSPSSDPGRNGKGFRDWIGPFLDCPLVHDDYDGYIDLYKDIVPMYIYNDIQDCVEKINWVKSLDKEDRTELIKRQIQFAELNTIENQLYRAYKKYVLKTEPNLDVIEKIKFD